MRTKEIKEGLQKLIKTVVGSSGRCRRHHPYRTPEGAENRDIIMSVMGTMSLQGADCFETGRNYILNTLT